jgi:hypothetical protein
MVKFMLNTSQKTDDEINIIEPVKIMAGQELLNFKDNKAYGISCQKSPCLTAFNEYGCPSHVTPLLEFHSLDYKNHLHPFFFTVEILDFFLGGITWPSIAPHRH